MKIIRQRLFESSRLEQTYRQTDRQTDRQTPGKSYLPGGGNEPEISRKRSLRFYVLKIFEIETFLDFLKQILSTYVFFLTMLRVVELYKFIYKCLLSTRSNSRICETCL